MNFINGSGTDRPAVTAGVGAKNDGDPNAAELLEDSFIFDPATEAFTPVEERIDGHWYPTLTKLGNGDAHATGGNDTDSRGPDATELFCGREPLAGPDRGRAGGAILGTYPEMPLLSDRRVFSSGVQTFTAGQAGPAASFHDVAAVREEAFVFGGRVAGDSKATFRQSLHFLRQLASLRFGLMSRFAAVGAFGTVLNLAIMAVILGLGTHYLLAAIVATELTILSNFLMQERLVFRDLRGGRPFWQRILASFGFNNVETLVRVPVLVLLVDLLLIPGLVAQAATLACAFLIRFAFTSRVIYRIRPAASRPRLLASFPEEQLS